MCEIMFIRHGQASFGRGDYDVLSERGREQSVLAARNIMNCGILFDSAYSGMLRRQKDTADIILGYFMENKLPQVPGLRQLRGLDEYDSEKIMKHYVPIILSEDESLVPVAEKIYTDRKSFQLVFEKVMARWLSGDSASEDVEGWPEFRQRVFNSIQEIVNENKKGSRIAVFSSGGVISAAVQIATGMSPAEAIRTGWGLVNTSVTRFRYGSSGLILHSLNCYAHLELNKSGELITYR